MKEHTERIIKLQYGMEIGYGQEIVRCKDCKHGYEINRGMMIMCTHGVHLDAHERDWFCADGEWRETDA